jgi:signal peptidase I
LEHVSNTPAEPNRTARPRRPWLAGVLSLLVPGLGHVYAGCARRGLVLALGYTLGAVASLHLSMVVSHPAWRLLSLALAFGMLLGIVLDAIRSAARTLPEFLSRWYNRWYIYAGIGLLVVLVVQPYTRAVTLRHVAEAFVIPSRAMEPTILVGDYLLAAPLPQGPIPRGTPVVYHDRAGFRAVSRAIGLPGDTVEMRGKALYINGQAQRESYVHHIDPHGDPADSLMLWQREFLATPVQSYEPTRDHWGPLVVPEGYYFILSDNRDFARDSRYIGLVAREQIIKRPVWIYLSRGDETERIRWGRIGQGIW